MSDWIAILISFGYVVAVLGVAETIRKIGGFQASFTRKFVHIAVGMWVVGTIYLFESRWMAIIPPCIFTILNFIAYRQGLLQSIESEDEANLGTVYFPIAFGILILIFWERPNILAASLMALTWGDAMAAVVGQTYGRTTYRVFNHTRSLEGSISMFLFSWLSTFLALWLLPTNTVQYTTLTISLGIAGLVALAATGVEAVSPWGVDNLTIPAVSGLLLYSLMAL